MDWDSRYNDGTVKLTKSREKEQSMGVADGLTRPLRTRERAALDAARSALRKIALRRADDAAGDLAKSALERIAVLLGERDE